MVVLDGCFLADWWLQIARDLMFRRFIDLSLSEAVPDHSTIWRFRQLLNTENLLEALLEQILFLFLCLLIPSNLSNSFES
jgi:hypothetical protein